MREFFKYAYYLIYVLVIVTFNLVIVALNSIATSYFLACASLWFVLWIGLMLTRPVEYLYLIAWSANNSRNGRVLCRISHKLNSKDRIEEWENHLGRQESLENVCAKNIQLISKTYHE